MPENNSDNFKLRLSKMFGPVIGDYVYQLVKQPLWLLFLISIILFAVMIFADSEIRRLTAINKENQLLYVLAVIVGIVWFFGTILIGIRLFFKIAGTSIEEQMGSMEKISTTVVTSRENLEKKTGYKVRMFIYYFLFIILVVVAVYEFWQTKNFDRLKEILFK